MSDSPYLRDAPPPRSEAQALACAIIRHVTTLRLKNLISSEAATEITAFIEGRVARPGGAS